MKRNYYNAYISDHFSPWTLKALKYFSANPSFDMYKITDVNGGLWIAVFGDDIYIKIITTSPFWYLL